MHQAIIEDLCEPAARKQQVITWMDRVRILRNYFHGSGKFNIHLLLLHSKFEKCEESTSCIRRK